MRSTFFGLQIGYKALAAQQSALDVTGNNIANANTTGYSRQIPTLVATPPYMINGMTGHKLSFGSGSAVDTVLRARDQFIDRQYRWETTKQQYWEGQRTSFSQIEGILNEPAKDSLRTDMDKFFTAWGTLANDPENSGSKAVVQQRALALADTFHHISQQLTDLKNNLDNNISVEVKQINDYAQQIAQLNDQIKKGEVGGASLNDLKDKRDSIIDELSKLVNVQVIESQDPNFTDRNVGIVKIVIGDEAKTPQQVLVDDGNSYKLNDYVKGADPGVVTWATGPAAGQTLEFGDKLGMLQSNLDMRNNDLPEFMKDFDTLANKFAEAVNTIYKDAFTAAEQGDGTHDGGQFFTSSSGGTITAANITIAPTINADSSNIRAGLPSTPPNPQDGTLAKEISSLLTGWTTRTSAFASDTNLAGAKSIEDFYGTMVATLGVKSQTATRMKSGQDVLVNSMYNQREQVSGVSLDEEMTNLMRFQKSYAAAARVVTMMDDLLDKVVNGMGVTR